jgi:type IV secretion system protein VirD4
MLLGWESNRDAGFGFNPTSNSASPAPAPIWYDGDNHLTTFARTGAGKGRCALIPTLLTYPGPAIVVDVKGEAYQVTARRRREMGHRVIVLDPFGVVASQGDSLNPFDVFHLRGANAEADAEMLAASLSAGHEMATDQYWNDTARGLIAGLIAHIQTSLPPAERHLNTLRKWLYNEDLDYLLASEIENNKVTCPLARDEFVAYLKAPEERTRPCILTTAMTYVKALGSEVVAKALGNSTFDLLDVHNGTPMTIYMVMPPDKLESHRNLMRLWVSTLLTTVGRRAFLPQQRTLFLLDECAQLGALPMLKQAITLMRGYGLQVWTFWQDLSQLQQLYPLDWKTLLNNSGVLQLFGFSPLATRDWADLLGMGADAIHGLGTDEAFLLSDKRELSACRRLDYLTDETFAGLFDVNVRFSYRPPAPRSRDR